MVYAAMDIARYVINYCIDKENPISNLKLQKILYYIQAAFLLERNNPCFDDAISRWRHGPVVVDVYNQYSKFIGENINEEQDEYTDYEFDKDLNVKVVTRKFNSDIIKEKDKKLIDEVVSSLINIGPWELVLRTHEEKPWINTDPNQEITKEVIKNYFIENENGERIYGRG